MREALTYGIHVRAYNFSVAHCCELVTKILKLSEFPTVPAVSALVLSNGPALEYLDAVAHAPWNTPEELINSGEEVHAEALKVLV